jgi:hypothetical protein
MEDDSRQIGTQRSVASLSLFVVVCVVIVTGIIAFLRPFSITVISLHAIFGLCFVITAIWHIKNNFPSLWGYLKTREAIACIVLASALGTAILLQVAPVRIFMQLCANASPSPVKLVDEDDQIKFEYVVSDDYLLEMVVQKGSAYPATPPRMAIWLENQSAFHIHTLYATDGAEESGMLPYWSYKRGRWKKAKDEFETKVAKGLDAVSSATRNSSFDPADYMLADDQRYTVMLEIDVAEVMPGTSDAERTSSSLIYSVEIDNADPAHFQVLGRLGVPEQVPQENTWQIGYDVSGLDDALAMLDSTLVTIYRKESSNP